MATTIYLPASGAAAVSPAFDAGFGHVGSAVRLRCVTVKLGTAQTDFAIAGAGASGDTLVAQYTSDPLSGPQTISGTMQAFIRCLENAAANNITPSIVAKVVSNDGATVRGTLLSHVGLTTWTEFPITTAASIGYPAAATAITTVNALDQDRLCFDIGWNQNSSTAATEHMLFGDDQTTDYSAEADATIRNAVILLSATLTFGSTPSGKAPPPRNRLLRNPLLLR